MEQDHVVLAKSMIFLWKRDLELAWSCGPDELIEKALVWLDKDHLARLTITEAAHEIRLAVIGMLLEDVEAKNTKPEIVAMWLPQSRWQHAAEIAVAIEGA